MDELEKSKIRLKHWIDHNEDHIKGYREVAESLSKAGFAEQAEKISKGITLIQEANDQFKHALGGFDQPASGCCSGRTEGDAHDHPHHHHHDHAHVHEHSHDHHHEHSHEHDHHDGHGHCQGEEHPHDHEHGSHGHCRHRHSHHKHED